MNDVIKIKKTNQVSNVKVSHEASSFYADLSKQWAIKLDKPIENGEYSSKYYAKIFDLLLKKAPQKNLHNVLSKNFFGQFPTEKLIDFAVIV